MTAATAPDLEVGWRPLPGFQVKALACSTDEALLGGAAGPGKSDCLLVGALRDVNAPWFKGLILRRTFPELRDLMDRAHQLFPRLGGVWNAQERRYLWEGGGTVEFGYLETYTEVLQYQGRQFTYIAYDELGNMPEERTWLYLASRNRSPDPTSRCFMRASANPGGPGAGWIRARFIDPTEKGAKTYRDPETGLTRAFIPGRLADNTYLGEAYRRRLLGLPEVLRKQLLEGDWDAGLGLAFGELGETTHLTPRLERVPAWWPQWGGFDWGYAHWAVFTWLAVDGDGIVQVIDTIWMRRQQPDQIGAIVAEQVPLQQMDAVYAGPDCWSEVKARGDTMPTIAEKLHEYGWPIAKASTARRAGYRELRDRVCYRGRGDRGEDGPKQVLFWDTPGNKRLIAQLRRLAIDPDVLEDVLKVDAEAETGEGGDDGYDAWRYGVATRQFPREEPPKAPRRGPDVDTVRFLTPPPDDSEDESSDLVGGLPAGF